MIFDLDHSRENERRESGADSPSVARSVETLSGISLQVKLERSSNNNRDDEGPSLLDHENEKSVSSGGRPKETKETKDEGLTDPMRAQTTRLSILQLMTSTPRKEFVKETIRFVDKEEADSLKT